MDERILCKCCRAMILPATAERNRGKCMPCAKQNPKQRSKKRPGSLIDKLIPIWFLNLVPCLIIGFIGADYEPLELFAIIYCAIQALPVVILLVMGLLPDNEETRSFKEEWLPWLIGASIIVITSLIYSNYTFSAENYKVTTYVVIKGHNTGKTSGSSNAMAIGILLSMFHFLIFYFVINICRGKIKKFVLFVLILSIFIYSATQQMTTSRRVRDNVTE
jgi:hypothetical protein